tara:strand:- start:158 stop:481 length:324 start_codon:yes stop_codon:yes gene_type:complete
MCQREYEMSYDHSRKFIDKHAMAKYYAIDKKVGERYGKTVLAIEISNREYQHRYNKLSASRAMKEPPSSGRIFLGYLVVRNVSGPDEYETWIPGGAFDEIYQPEDNT